MTGEPTDPKSDTGEDILEVNQRRTHRAVQEIMDSEKNMQVFLNNFISSVPVMMNVVDAEARGNRLTADMRERLDELYSHLKTFRQFGEEVNRVTLAIPPALLGFFSGKKLVLGKESLSDAEVKALAHEFSAPYVTLRKTYYEEVRKLETPFTVALDGFPQSPVRDALVNVNRALKAFLEVAFPPVRH